jgi:hypothetical protein
VGRGRAKVRESGIRRVLLAARKAGVQVRLDIRDEGIVLTTIGEAAAQAMSDALTAEDELKRWRRKRQHEA